MDTDTIIEELTDVAERMGMEVRVEKGNFRGGRCQVGDTTVIMLNKRHMADVQLAVLANSLREAPLDTVYLKPAVRDALESVWADADAANDSSAPNASDNSSSSANA